MSGSTALRSSIRPSAKAAAPRTLGSELAVLVVLGLGATSSTNVAQSAVMATVPSSRLARGTSAGATERFEEIVKELSEASDPSQRVHAAELLGQLGDRRATKPLIGALNDSDHAVQRAVALALGQVRDHQAVPPLLEVLETTRATAPLPPNATEKRREIATH